MRARPARLFWIGCFVLGAVCAGSIAGAADGEGGVASFGPDVVVAKISSIANYTCRTPPGGPGQPCLDPLDDPENNEIDAFAVGTVSCNIGTQSVLWQEGTRYHPVIRSGMFRLMGGRFEQIGTSWVKHGFISENEASECVGECQNTTPAYELYPGCSDPYSASLNGSWARTGPPSAINASSGYFPGPASYAGSSTWQVGARLQVHYSDLDLTKNVGAIYFFQSHYVASDDAAAGNGNNNAGYRRASVSYDPVLKTYDAAVVSTTRQEPAISAWKEFDPGVLQVEAQVPDEGLFIVSARVTNLGGSLWHYEYAVENLNSDRSAGLFAVPLPEFVVLSDIGFHDVDHHSGEPYSRTDWTATVTDDEIRWETVPFQQTVNANALRWSTLYNFRFNANVGPAESSVTIGLFKTGFPSEIAVRTTGPARTLIDCNNNYVRDLCDISCANEFCVEPCGGSADCDHNSIPDECELAELDCNHNGIPDACDLINCPPGNLACGDCNHNTVPDGCEPDCDDDGIPDTCEVSLDCDGDGVLDCGDVCQCTTPPDGCAPPLLVNCRLPSGFCIAGMSRDECVSGGSTPVCGREDTPCTQLQPCPDSACHQGCLVGDIDRDGDIDLYDVIGIQACFSGPVDGPAFVIPSSDCLFIYDSDDDGDVDEMDARDFQERLAGPRE